MILQSRRGRTGQCALLIAANVLAARDGILAAYRQNEESRLIPDNLANPGYPRALFHLVSWHSNSAVSA